MRLNNLNSYDNFISYCLEQLGQGAVDIEVTPNQILNRITDAIQYYAEFHFDGAREDIIIVDLERDIREYNLSEYLGDKVVLSVISELRTTSLTDWFARNALLFANQHSPISLFSNFRNLDNLLITMQFIDTLKNTFQPTNTFNFNYTTQRLSLLNNPITETVAAGDSIGSETKRAFRCFIVDAFKRNSEGELEASNDIFNNRWFKRYCTAQIKYQWGQNLMKFGDISLPGGMTIKADNLRIEAKEEIEKLDEELKKMYRKPLPFIFK